MLTLVVNMAIEIQRRAEWRIPACRQAGKHDIRLSTVTNFAWEYVLTRVCYVIYSTDV